MNQDIMSFLKDKRFKIIIILAAIISVLTFVFGFREFAVGVLIATPLGIINYWIMWDGIQREQTGKNTMKTIFLRSLVRLLISGAALILAIQISFQFLFGVMVGLFLHLFTYASDVIDIVTGKKFKY